jgi:hypothetical protein
VPFEGLDALAVLVVRRAKESAALLSLVNETRQDEDKVKKRANGRGCGLSETG